MDQPGPGPGDPPGRRDFRRRLVAYGSGLLASAALTVQDPLSELSLFHRRCHLSLRGSITSFRMAASA